MLLVFEEIQSNQGDKKSTYEILTSNIKTQASPHCQQEVRGAYGDAPRQERVTAALRTERSQRMAHKIGVSELF